MFLYDYQAVLHRDVRFASKGASRACVGICLGGDAVMQQCSEGVIDTKVAVLADSSNEQMIAHRFLPRLRLDHSMELK